MNNELHEEGLFYADDLPAKDRKTLEGYVAEKNRLFASLPMQRRHIKIDQIKWGAGGCGGCGLVAAPDITAMGIESFLVCSLLILLDLGKSEKRENRS